MKTVIAHPPHHALTRHDPLWGIFIVSFIVLLLVAVCAQLVARPWRSWLPGAEGKESLVGGVKSSVYTFMSYLT